MNPAILHLKIALSCLEANDWLGVACNLCAVAELGYFCCVMTHFCIQLPSAAQLPFFQAVSEVSQWSPLLFTYAVQLGEFKEQLFAALKNLISLLEMTVSVGE
jgi:hypothetical protein